MILCWDDRNDIRMAISVIRSSFCHLKCLVRMGYFLISFLSFDLIPSFWCHSNILNQLDLPQMTREWWVISGWIWPLSLKRRSTNFATPFAINGRVGRVSRPCWSPSSWRSHHRNTWLRRYCLSSQNWISPQNISRIGFLPKIFPDCSSGAHLPSSHRR